MKLAKLLTTLRMVKTERPSSSISAMEEWMRGRSAMSKRWIASVSSTSLRSGSAIRDPSQNANGSVAPTKASASANSVRRSLMIWA